MFRVISRIAQILLIAHSKTFSFLQEIKIIDFNITKILLLHLKKSFNRKKIKFKEKKIVEDSYL